MATATKPKAEKTINRLTMRERHKLANRLESVMNINAENHTADYKAGWNDAKIAAEFKMNEGTVAYNRRQIFGNYSTKVKAPKLTQEAYQALMQRLDDAFGRIGTLETSMAKMTADMQMMQDAATKPVQRPEAVRKIG
jgi:hypothetical protein